MDVYVECMVSRTVTSKQKMMKAMWIAMMVITFLASALFGMIFFLFFLLTWGLTVHFNNRMTAMYEYTYMNGEMTFTRMTTNKRKKLFTCDMDHVEQVCPYKEFRAPGNKNAFAKVRDFGSGVANDNLYIMVVNTEKGKIKIYFEPDADFLDAMWRHTPRIVTKKR